MAKPPTPDDPGAGRRPFWDVELLRHLVVIMVAGVGLVWPYFDDSPRQLMLRLPASPALIVTIAGCYTALFIHRSPERP